MSVLFYDQPCATERRRLRKRGKWPDPDKRVYINAAVCEGCGDCGKTSNCLSIEPLETPLGRKRRINQASCNKDFSCVEGFCPSFVTVHGGRLRKAQISSAPDAASAPMPTIPEPAIARPTGACSVLVTGVGGTGVVTIGQIIGMAAHLDGLCASILDMTGLAQKYGAVMSHVRVAPDAGALHATRIAAGEADAVIGCDLLVTAGDEALSKIGNGRTRVAVCTDLVPTAEFARNPDWHADAAALVRRVEDACGETAVFAIDAIRVAAALMGDPIAANMFMLGVAWQHGWIPVSQAAILRAIELNNVAVEFNQQCFQWGRRAGHDRAGVLQRVAPVANVVSFTPRETVDSIVAATRCVPHGVPGRGARESLPVAGRSRRAGGTRTRAWLIGCRARSHCITSSCWRSRTNGRSRDFTARPNSGASSKRRSTAISGCASISVHGRSPVPIRPPAQS